MIKRYSVQSKPELINAIIERITDKEILLKFLYKLDDVEWEFFQEVAREKHIQSNTIYINSYQFLYSFGIIQIFYHQYNITFVVPNEVKRVYSKIVQTDFLDNKKFQFTLNDYAIATINLYGVISQDDFIKLYNSQNSRKTDVDEMFSVLKSFVMFDIGYRFWDIYIVSDSFEDNDYKDVVWFAKKAALKPRYTPHKRELLKYSDRYYFEMTKQHLDLKKYINTNLTDDYDLTDDLIEDIHELCINNPDTQEFIDLFEENDIFFDSFEQTQELIMLITDVQNSTRIWKNNGHTPNELSRQKNRKTTPKFKLLMEDEKPKPVMKNNDINIGRNQSCPCGSGKKYKKCCMLLSQYPIS